MVPCLTDGVHSNVKFREQNFVAGASRKIAIDNRCELILPDKSCAEDPLDIAPAFSRSRIGYTAGAPRVERKMFES
jgi:hypothetical protein